MSQSPKEPCPYCGAPETGGYTGCQGIMDALTLRMLDDPVGSGGYALRRAVVDCYCLQHPEIYCVSAKSYAAHLTGLCVWEEHGGSQEINETVRRWLDGRKDMSKPAIPDARGVMTVAFVAAAKTPADLRGRAKAWAQSTWAAYADLWVVARMYIVEARMLQGSGRRRARGG